MADQSLPLQAAPEAAAASPKNGIIVGIIAVSVVVIIAAVAVIVFVLKPFGSSENTPTPDSVQVASQLSSSASQTSSSAASSSAAASSASASSSSSVSSSSASSSSAASSSASASTPAPISLSDSDDYYDINIFLSNFAEWLPFWEGGKKFDRDNYDMDQVIEWGMWHNALNNSEAIEEGSYRLSGAPASEASKGIDGISSDTYLRRMQTSAIDRSIQRYLGLNLSLSGYESSAGRYCERDGYMYEGTYRGTSNPIDNVVLSTNVEGLGKNTMRVDFTIYMGSHEFQEVADKSWYGMSGSDLEAAMLANGSTGVAKKTGTAVVEVVGSGNDRSFQLVSFQVND